MTSRIGHFWTFSHGNGSKCQYCGVGQERSRLDDHCQKREDAINSAGYDRVVGEGLVKNSATGQVHERVITHRRGRK